MNTPDLELKVSFISGLRPFVVNEIGQHPHLNIRRAGAESLYLDFPNTITDILQFRSITRVAIVRRDLALNPHYVSKHKSLLGEMVERVLENTEYVFTSFKLTCAGAGSQSARSIASYIQDTYRLDESEDADLKVQIIKTEGMWEMGVQMTPRPLSSRSYKVWNMGGALDPTIAYAMNTLGDLTHADSYLNVFSGSATLLIEAALSYPQLKNIVGFDNRKDVISHAIQNIRKAGVIRRVRLKEKDIFDHPDLGTFDVITADLPFGMLISKNEDIKALYRAFLRYCQASLNPGGRVIVYTSEHELFEKCIPESTLTVEKTFELTFMTAGNSYLRPKIFVCTI